MEDRIIEILNKQGTNTLTKEEIYNKLGYTNLDKNEFEEIFEEMKEKHLIYQRGKDSYSRNPFVEGEVVITKKGDILVKCDLGTIKIEKTKENCISGDEVKVKIGNFSELTGTISEVIKRKKISAEVETRNGQKYAITKDGNEYKIDLDNGIVDGSIIGITIETDKSTKKPIAILDKVMGHKDDPRLDDEIILYENNFNYEWPEDIEEELSRIPSDVLEKDKKGRVDLRNRIIFTIDGDDTKDIDDAISLNKLPNNNYLLGVHIADVSHYVSKGSAIDREAYERATSVYMNTTSNPMYPRKLSNGICSLNPGTDRLAISCEMEINERGKIVSYNIFESLIHSKKQMTYKNVNNILEESEVPEGYEDYKDILLEMNKLAHILKEARIKRGYQEFDDNEIKINTDENGKPVEISKRETGEGQELIEQFMLEANETVATHIHGLGIESIYRDHDKPDEERLKHVVTMIRNYGDELEIKGKTSSPKYVQQLISKVKEMTRQNVYLDSIKRCLAKASYEAYNIGHYSLGINANRGEAYTHFTSPIRRYPDTTIHRVLKTSMHGSLDKLYDNKAKAEMVAISKHSSIQERNADKCEKESNKMKSAEYMADFIGEEYQATIISFTGTGLYVQLPNLIEGRVSYNSLNDFYRYDEELELLVGERTGNTYKLGDEVVVTLVKSNKDLREIDFEINIPKTRKR